jgi:hypothetical protein
MARSPQHEQQHEERDQPERSAQRGQADAEREQYREEQNVRDRRSCWRCSLQLVNMLPGGQINFPRVPAISCRPLRLTKYTNVSRSRGNISHSGTLRYMRLPAPKIVLAPVRLQAELPRSTLRIATC